MDSAFTHDASVEICRTFSGNGFSDTLCPKLWRVPTGGSTPNLVELEPPLGFGDDAHDAVSDPEGTPGYGAIPYAPPPVPMKLLTRPRSFQHSGTTEGTSKPKMSWPHPPLTDS